MGLGALEQEARRGALPSEPLEPVDRSIGGMGALLRARAGVGVNRYRMKRPLPDGLPLILRIRENLIYGWLLKMQSIRVHREYLFLDSKEQHLNPQQETHMKRFGLSLRLPLSLVAAVMLGTGCGGTEEDSQPQVELSDDEKIAADLDQLSAEKKSGWDAVKKALTKYKDVNVATAEGYIPVSPCESLPGSGGMGIHYLHPGLASDLASDPFKPEILLYVPNKNGGLTFLGPEYFQADAGQGQPSVLGQGFDGPMPGHSPDMPVHYDLHVWLFKYNPSGLFAVWNPEVKCP